MFVESYKTGELNGKYSAASHRLRAAEVQIMKTFLANLQKNNRAFRDASLKYKMACNIKHLRETP
jgi:hypothetical protein